MKEVKFAETTGGSTTILHAKGSIQEDKNYDMSDGDTEILTVKSFLLKDIDNY